MQVVTAVVEVHKFAQLCTTHVARAAWALSARSGERDGTCADWPSSTGINALLSSLCRARQWSIISQICFHFYISPASRCDCVQSRHHAFPSRSGLHRPGRGLSISPPLLVLASEQDGKRPRRWNPSTRAIGNWPSLNQGYHVPPLPHGKGQRRIFAYDIDFWMTANHRVSDPE